VIFTPVTWSKKLVLGYPSFDEDHKTLVQMLNNVLMGIYAQLDETILVTACDDLLLFTQRHFQREELAMKRFLYPLKDEHTSEHNELSGLLANTLKGLVQTRDTSNFEELQGQLNGWLTEHILEHDREAAEFILSEESRRTG